jgi:hypothetical protein
MSNGVQLDEQTRRRNRKLAFWISAVAIIVMVLGSYYLVYFGLPTDRFLYH